MDRESETTDIRRLSETIRWKVVKMAHKLKDDMEVAKMLLDCYDAIISGCLQWKNNSRKKRIPYVTSDCGWKLLEEIMFMMEWKERQESRRNLLTLWVDDDREEEQSEDQCEDRDTDWREVDDKDNNDDNVGDADDGTDDEDWQSDDNRPTIRQASSKVTATGSSKISHPQTVALVIDNQESKTSSPKSPQKKKRIKYASKGYKKTGRPTKATEILNTPTQTKVIECKRCLDRFTSTEEFVKHFQRHTQAVIIGKTVQKVSDMKIEEIPFVANILIPCKDCNELTDNLETHQINKHFRRACELCGNSFTSYGGWSRHMKTHRAKQTGIKPHVCDKCGKSFALLGTLTMHRKLHSSERSHMCEVCGKGFKLSSRLNRHLSIHTTKSLSCEYCGKTFNYKFNLKTHLRTHTGERPFSCTTCGKSYSHNSSLKAHAKSEHGIDMEYGCQALMEFEDLSGTNELESRVTKQSSNSTESATCQSPQSSQEMPQSSQEMPENVALPVAVYPTEFRTIHEAIKSCRTGCL